MSYMRQNINKLSRVRSTDWKSALTALCSTKQRCNWNTNKWIKHEKKKIEQEPIAVCYSLLFICLIIKLHNCREIVLKQVLLLDCVPRNQCSVTPVWRYESWVTKFKTKCFTNSFERVCDFLKIKTHTTWDLAVYSGLESFNQNISLSLCYKCA